MARYKEYSYDQGKLIPITFREQIIPGSFEFALNDIVDNVLDLSLFEKRFSNDETGAPAYDPRVMLKIVLYAYSRGIMHSRDISRCCVENVMFMALSADTRPHFTTIADFISSMHEEIVPLFRNILLYCAEEGLISREMFAIDGCRMSSNCAKEWSGTREDFEKRKKKIEYQVRFLLRKHRECDKKELGDNIIKKERKAINHLRYQGWKTKCRVCDIRKKCLRSDASEARQVVMFDQTGKGPSGSFTRRMITKFDSALGRFIYSRRMGTVEPVFANICSTIGLNRITLRGKVKADTQWKLYSMVHNIFKIYRYGASYAH